MALVQAPDPVLGADPVSGSLATCDYRSMRGVLLVDDHASSGHSLGASSRLLGIQSSRKRPMERRRSSPRTRRVSSASGRWMRKTVYLGHGQAFDFARLKFRAQVGSDRRSATAQRLPGRRLEVLVDRIRPTTSCRNTPVRRVTTANISNVSGSVRSAPHRGG